MWPEVRVHKRFFYYRSSVIVKVLHFGKSKIVHAGAISVDRQGKIKAKVEQLLSLYRKGGLQSRYKFFFGVQAVIVTE